MCGIAMSQGNAPGAGHGPALQNAVLDGIQAPCFYNGMKGNILQYKYFGFFLGVNYQY